MSSDHQALPPTKSIEEASQESVLANLRYLRKEMTSTMREVSQISDRSSSTLLLTLGAITLLFAFLFKLRLFGANVADLTSGEFVAAIIIALVLLLVGAAIRLYQFKKEQEAGKRIRETGVELLSKSLDISAGMATHRAP